MNLVFVSTKVNDLFYYTNGAHEFSVKFCVVKFSSFGSRFDGLWNKELKEPKLWDAQGTRR